MVRLPRRIWLQLAILAAVTLIAVGVMAFGFVNVPALIGIGRYNVTLQLPASGGLYPTSVVTYRGSEIGRVTSIDVTPDGVRANLKLQSSTKDPLRRVGGCAQSVGRRRTVRGTDARRRRRRHRGRWATVTSYPSAGQDSARYRWPARRHEQGVAGDPAATTSRPWSTKPTRRSRGSARSCPASSTDRHRSRAMPPRTRTRSPS